ncbi:MAG TPA: hypothetical protein VFR36_01500 [Sphingomicrobium sp.]|nr:hypothetical protein [Sphingomicrobium sp.]
MSVWTSAFRHQFLDGNPLNFDAIAGTTGTILPDGLAIKPTPPPTERGFVVRPGHQFNYLFESPIQDAIGADISLSVVLPPAPANAQRSGRVILTGPPIRLLIDFVGDIVRLQLYVGSANPIAASAPILGPSMDIRARWHTHGQAQIWTDGEIRAYNPDIARGSGLTFQGIEFGHHSPQLASSARQFLIKSIMLKVLRRDDSARFIDQLFPIAVPAPLDPNCLKKMRATDGQSIRIVREFMGGALSRLSSADSIIAHRAAEAAGLAFVRFMSTRDPQHAESVKTSLAEMLEVLKQSDSSAFKQSFDALKQVAGDYDPACLAQLEPLAQQHATELQELATVLEGIAKVIEEAGGANG